MNNVTQSAVQKALSLLAEMNAYFSSGNSVLPGPRESIPTHEWIELHTALVAVLLEPTGTTLVNVRPLWLPMSTAPKDRPIVALCEHSADAYCAANGRLTDYGARAEGLSHVNDGPCVVIWEKSRVESDGHESPDYTVPAGWSTVHDREVMANPVGWSPIPDDRKFIAEIFTAGDVYAPDANSDMWTASIDIPGHGSAIECYGATEQAARALRNAVLNVTAATGIAVSRELHMFMDSAAGEGVVFGGIDAANLYVKLFPAHYAAEIATESNSQNYPSGGVAVSVSEMLSHEQSVNDAVDAKWTAATIPEGSSIVPGFEFDGLAQVHAPTVLVRFPAVKVNTPLDEGSWAARDRFVAQISTEVLAQAVSGNEFEPFIRSDGKTFIDDLLVAETKTSADEEYECMLVVDLARELNVPPTLVCATLQQLGLGNHSINMAVTRKMAREVRLFFTLNPPVLPEPVLGEFIGWHRSQASDWQKKADRAEAAGLKINASSLRRLADWHNAEANLLQNGEGPRPATVIIKAETVQQLRAESGEPMLDCKKALCQANGDMVKAREILRTSKPSPRLY